MVGIIAAAAETRHLAICPSLVCKSICCEAIVTEATSPQPAVNAGADECIWLTLAKHLESLAIKSHALPSDSLHCQDKWLEDRTTEGRLEPIANCTDGQMLAEFLLSWRSVELVCSDSLDCIML